MTHGDKAKAKAAKSSKASVTKAGIEGGENGKSKTVRQTVQASKGSKAGETSAKGESSSKAGSEKAAAAQKSGGLSKGSASRPDPKGKTSAARNGAADETGGFNNPVIGAAFKQALKKYPNALRKLTD